jgi:ketosteroid isomerase-like protein
MYLDFEYGGFSMRTILCVCALLAVVGGVVAAQDKAKVSDEEGKILALESVWNRAEQSRDAGAMSHMLAPTMTYVDYDGSIRNREQFLEYVKKDASSPDQLTTEDVAIHSYGDSAVVTGVFKGKWSKNGKATVLKGRYTDTWAKVDGMWLCVASQATLIQGPSAAK